jgi:Pentapeptide repeats (9 copies)
MADPENVSWEPCEEDGCHGVPLPKGGGKCWAHADEEGLDVGLKQLGDVGHLDVRGTTITAELLKRILAAVPRDARGSPKLINPCFDKAVFTGDADFSKASLEGEVGFLGTTFEGDAYFSKVTFHDEVRFSDATFRGFATFHSAVFHEYAEFTDTDFQGWVAFNGTTFHGGGVFDSATFQGSALFAEATFHMGVGFADVTFQSGATFAWTTFTERPSSMRPTSAVSAGSDRCWFARRLF